MSVRNYLLSLNTVKLVSVTCRMFLNFVFFLHLLGLSLSPTALLLTCVIEALFSLGQIIITEYDILHVVSLLKKKKKSEAPAGVERTSWVPDFPSDHPPFCFLVVVLTQGALSHQMTILPNNSAGSFLCYFLRIFSLWASGFPIQLILRSWAQQYKF